MVEVLYICKHSEVQEMLKDDDVMATFTKSDLEACVSLIQDQVREDNAIGLEQGLGFVEEEIVHSSTFKSTVSSELVALFLTNLGYVYSFQF